MHVQWTLYINTKCAKCSSECSAPASSLTPIVLNPVCQCPNNHTPRCYVLCKVLLCYVLSVFCVLCLCFCFFYFLCVCTSCVVCECVYMICCVWTLCCWAWRWVWRLVSYDDRLTCAPQWHLYPALSNEPLTCVSFCICGLVKGNFWIYWHLFCIQRGKKHNFGFVLPECVFHLKDWLQSVE